MELVGFLATVYLFTLIVGLLLEEIRIPWIFAALILGVILSVVNPFSALTGSDTFQFLANIGMYLMLFLIGFELDVGEIKSKSRYIVSSAFFIILLEGFIGSLIVHFVFGYSWLISLLVSISFATVGEAMLFPILDEFDLIDTDLGQTIVGIGVMDDAIEVLAVIATSIVLGAFTGHGHLNIGVTLGSLAALFLLTYGLTELSPEGKELKVWNIETVFLIVVFLFFLFVGIGRFAEASALGALLAGVSIKSFLPQNRLEVIEDDLKSIAYGLFGPLFFLWVGVETNASYLFSNIWLIVLVVLVANSAKLLGSYIVGRNRLGIKESLVMGVGLSVRFSTSIVIIKLLYEGGIIQTGLYSVLVASTIAFKFLVPTLMSAMITRWNISPE